MKTVSISVITFFIGGGLVYNSLSHDLLGCRLSLEHAATELIATKEELIEVYQYYMEEEDNKEVLEEYKEMYVEI